MTVHNKSVDRTRLNDGDSFMFLVARRLLAPFILQAFADQDLKSSRLAGGLAEGPPPDLKSRGTSGSVLWLGADLWRHRLEGPLPGVKLTLPAGKRTSPHEGLLSSRQRKSEGTPLNSRS